MKNKKPQQRYKRNPIIKYQYSTSISKEEAEQRLRKAYDILFTAILKTPKKLKK